MVSPPVVNNGIATLPPPPFTVGSRTVRLEGAVVEGAVGTVLDPHSHKEEVDAALIIEDAPVAEVGRIVGRDY